MSLQNRGRPIINESMMMNKIFNLKLPNHKENGLRLVSILAEKWAGGRKVTIQGRASHLSSIWTCMRYGWSWSRLQENYGSFKEESIYRIQYTPSNKWKHQNWKMPSCNRMDLESLARILTGSIRPKTSRALQHGARPVRKDEWLQAVCGHHGRNWLPKCLIRSRARQYL